MFLFSRERVEFGKVSLNGGMVENLEVIANRVGGVATVRTFQVERLAGKMLPAHRVQQRSSHWVELTRTPSMSKSRPPTAISTANVALAL